MKAPREHQRIIFRDVLIFQLKLFLDSAKDIILSPLSIIAALADVVSPTDRVGKRFYHVMLIGERMDKWMNLYGAAEHADPGDDGLFGASRAGSNTMLGRLETMVTGREETEPSKAAKKEDFDDHPLDWDRSDQARRKMEEFDQELRGGRNSNPSAPATATDATDATDATEVTDTSDATDAPSREELNHDVFGQPDP